MQKLRPNSIHVSPKRARYVARTSGSQTFGRHTLHVWEIYYSGNHQISPPSTTALDILQAWFFSAHFRPHRLCTQCIRCGILLQMSHVAWYVFGTRWNVQKWLNRSRCRFGSDSCESNDPCIRCGSILDGRIRSREGRRLVTYFGCTALYKCTYLLTYLLTYAVTC